MGKEDINNIRKTKADGLRRWRSVQSAIQLGYQNLAKQINIKFVEAVKQ